MTIFGNAQHEWLARISSDTECEHAAATCIIFDEREDFFRVFHFTVSLLDEISSLVPFHITYIIAL